MFDIAPTELLLCAIVAIVVIGPKDLPRAMRVVGQWVGRARSVANQFRAGFDTMVREAELEEMEKKWKTENERIMREHPTPPLEPDPQPDFGPAGTPQALLPADVKAEMEADADAATPPPLSPDAMLPTSVLPKPDDTAR